jgi:hypothetical protein
VDQAILVNSAQNLIKKLDNDGLKSLVAMLVHNEDVGTWKLWIVPADEKIDKFEFYRKISEVISKNRDLLGDFSASDVELASKNHPAMQGIGKIINIKGLGAVHFSGNSFNGFYMPDGIILRSALT